MDRKIMLALIFAIIFLIPSTLAIETTLKQEYKPGETLIAKISGNFIDNIKAENIQFYSGRLFTPLIYDLAKIQDSYYLYALLPDKERNYTLIIKNAHYLELGKEMKEDLKFDFVVEGNLSLFTVNPGFIITNKDFNIKTRSNVKALTIKAEFLGSSQEIEVKEGMEKSFSFSISKIKTFTVATLSISGGGEKYEIPVVIFPPETSLSEQEGVSQNLRFSKSFANFTVLKNSDFQFEIELMNTGQETIRDIYLNSDLNIVKIKPGKIKKLSPGSSEKINLTINSDKGGVRQGYLSAKSEDYSSQVPITVTTSKSEEELRELIKEGDIAEGKTCAEVKGKSCGDDEECSGVMKLTLEGYCCIGECKKKQARTGKTLALFIILIFLAVIGFFLYKKLKLKRETSREILEKKKKSYEERFKLKEARGSLSRI